MRTRPIGLWAKLVFCLALNLVAVQAEEFPTALQVAGQIDQEVRFQDEIKAVSWSRSTSGYYLSFGAPYPKQVVSVWVGQQLYDRLPGNHSLVGRIVRIKGKLETSPSGPLLKLGAPEQYQLVQTDESILTKEVLETIKDRIAFAAAVRQVFFRGEFQTLEVLAEELRQSRERSPDGDWVLERFFFAFHVTVNAPDRRYQAMQEQLAKWETAKPGSPVLALVQARFHIDRAAHAVGESYATSFTSETRRVYREEVATARHILERDPALKTYPEYYEFMEDVAICQTWPKEAFFQLFDEATRTFVEYEQFYHRAAEYLLPRWMGKKGEWEEFAEQQRGSHGSGGAGDGLYAEMVWSMEHHYRNIFRESAASWEHTAAGFEYLIRQYPDSKYLKNVYGNLAWRAADRERLHQMLPQIKADPDMGVWVNLENVGLAEKVANGDRNR